MRFLVTSLLTLGMFVQASALAQPADSTGRRPPIITTRIAVGVAAGIGIAASFDTKVRRTFQDQRSSGSNDAARIGNSFGSARTVGPALAASWLVATATGHREVAEATVWAAGSGAAAGVVTVVLKQIFGRTRPPGGDAFSFHPFSGDAAFPSGHTAFAFAIASSLAHSTPDRWTDVLFYGAATATGLSRINDDRHWLSDVVGGAALGILTGRQLRFHSRKVVPVAGGGLVGVAVTF